jgi:ankyrin repeat protein
MALHRGRIELLQDYLRRDPKLLNKRFSYRDIYPLELGCHEDTSLGLHGTPLDGTTLLHMCADFDEMDIARWLLKNGADVNAKARIDSEGFGGHTPLFNAVVSQANTCGRQQHASMAKLLLSYGADSSVRASIRKRLRFVDDESEHVYRDVTPLSYGQAFHEKRWTRKAVLQLLAEQSSTQ